MPIATRPPLPLRPLLLPLLLLLPPPLLACANAEWEEEEEEDVGPQAFRFSIPLGGGRKIRMCGIASTSLNEVWR